ncbi:MAG: Hpt domain-containing protein [Lentisphaeraceae bacterium]|nr:Hpt domain-containing protein [Lentisphaeraceae bacterium]
MSNFLNETKNEWMDRISRLYELELETVQELAEDSLEETTEHLDVLKKITPENLKDAERAAHSIKGTAASLGQQALSGAAYNVEKQLREQNLEGIEEKVKMLESTFDEFKVLVKD